MSIDLIELSRQINVTVTKACGNASKNALKYQLNIPSEWARQVGITLDSRAVTITLEGNTIKITKVTTTRHNRKGGL